ncbi:hypothetical protein [Alicyclobacillus fastidiosus]|uniref:hypothetical protein n=1 Tax=Alicyclobacillus fastidiosus TaxID=392011 RepID=UPI0034D73A0E
MLDCLVCGQSCAEHRMYMDRVCEGCRAQYPHGYSCICADCRKEVGTLEDKREQYPYTLTAKQVKEIMNIGINQVYEILRTRSDLPKFYVGRSPRVPRDAFFQWYDERWMSGERLEFDV